MTNVYSLVQDDASVFMIGDLADFKSLRGELCNRLLDTTPFNAGKWQQLDVSGSKAHDTHELKNVTLWMPIPHSAYLEELLEPDTPWARDHFWERVAGEPVNPGDTHTYWPYHRNGKDLHISYTVAGSTTVGKYAHNYMERYWPKKLNWPGNLEGLDRYGRPLGYRFPIGDLDDVVNLLVSDIGTRQAYLPVWFPEDTGAIENQRVPCSLGYHFMIRDGKLHCTYYLRSCEIYRHFTNDVYLTQMLTNWVADEIFRNGGPEVTPGQLTMHITSLHGFVGDTPQIKEMADG